ncbi:MAG: hypothetical protein EPO21_03420 [Chloroflexota bacterium]|nr:MAG: hypothetical protein EPO21_03420 [Chloroflexota bacterium]
MRTFLSLILFGLGLVYVVPLTGFMLLRGIPANPPWWLDLANTFTLYLFIPTVPLLVLGLLTFSRPTLLLCLLPVLLFVFLYGGLFLPRHSSPTAGQDTFTVMTHNVGAGSPNAPSVAQIVDETNADIVAIQELTDETAQALIARLGDQYRYRALLPRADYSGVGVFSRFPIESEESFTVGHLAQHLVLNIRGQRVHVFNFHPMAPDIQWITGHSLPPYMIRGFDTEWQTKQMAFIQKKVEEAEGPIVMVGDFNTTDQSRQYGQLTHNLTDVYREVGWGFGHTFPAAGYFPRLPFSVLRIDYIFHSRELTGREARVAGPTGSDHLPVIARLSLNNSSQ